MRVLVFLGVLGGCLWLSPARARAAPKKPSKQEVAQQLSDEPIDVKTWKDWSKRLRAWLTKDVRQDNEAFEAAWKFLSGYRFGRGLRRPLDRDAFAYYVLGNGYLVRNQLDDAAHALSQSIRHDKGFARAHRDLGLALKSKDPKKARHQLQEARKADPSLLPTLIKEEAQLAVQTREYEKSEQLQALVKQFPRDGALACYLAGALWNENVRTRGGDASKVMAAGRELRRARQLSTNPATILGAALVKDLDAAAPAILAKQAGAVASPEELQQLKKTPLTSASWKSWSGRFDLWRKNPNAPPNAEALRIASDFLKAQAKNGKDLPHELGQDPVALYVLGLTYLHESRQGKDKPVQHKWADLAQHQFYWAFQRQPNDALAHLKYAEAQVRLDQTAPQGDNGALDRAGKEMAEARRLDPTLKPDLRLEARIAVKLKSWDRAEEMYRQLLKQDTSQPKDTALYANEIAFCIWNNPKYNGKRVATFRPLVEQFPDNSRVASWNGWFLAKEGDVKAGAREIERARSLATKPEETPEAVIGAQNVKQIEDAAQTSLLEKWFWMTIYFFIFYGIVMGLMAGGGLLLARMNKGRRALQLLGERPKELVGQGQVVRTSHESWLTTLYAFSLIMGLILFYLSIPFVIIGLVVFTLFGIILAFFLSRQGTSNVGTDIMKASGGGTWAVLKCLFARFSDGSFGLHKTEKDCPRLYQVLTDVAKRVNTEPVTDIYLAPGSEIGVHQEGRGPFGIFGSKRRVLTLGLSTMHFLTVSEFRSIMAHEYAHFSHSDTYYSRFIYQVSLSIRKALGGMSESGGWVTWINPFYWFFFLYNKTYAMLSAGFSRSREFLADRMACSLYGSNTFASALTKVCTDGSLFEMTVYENIHKMLDKKKAFVNMYQAFRDFRNKQLDSKEREDLYQKLLDEKESLFASHPTFAERIDAVVPLPKALKANNNSALLLFEDPEAVERELTDFLTEVMHEVRRLRRE